jgi:hypothetical protein
MSYQPQGSHNLIVVVVIAIGPLQRYIWTTSA